MAFDGLNELSKDLRRTRDNADFALSRHHPSIPIVERVRDAIDSDHPFKMEFKVPREDSRVMLDLNFKLPAPTKGANSGAGINSNCEFFYTVTPTIGCEFNDEFNRYTTTTWGSYNGWEYPRDYNSAYQGQYVNGSEGVAWGKAFTTPGVHWVNQSQYNAPVSFLSSDWEVLIKFKWPAAPSTVQYSGNNAFHLIGFMTDIYEYHPPEYQWGEGWYSNSWWTSGHTFGEVLGAYLEWEANVGATLNVTSNSGHSLDDDIAATVVSTEKSLQEGTDYMFRAARSSNQIMAKVWEYSLPEPTNWDISTTILEDLKSVITDEVVPANGWWLPISFRIPYGTPLDNVYSIHVDTFSMQCSDSWVPTWLCYDGFNRTASNGWGSSGCFSWQPNGSTSPFSVSDGAGKMISSSDMNIYVPDVESIGTPWENEQSFQLTTEFTIATLASGEKYQISFGRGEYEHDLVQIDMDYTNITLRLANKNGSSVLGTTEITDLNDSSNYAYKLVWVVDSYHDLQSATLTNLVTGRTYSLDSFPTGEVGGNDNELSVQLKKLSGTGTMSASIEYIEVKGLYAAPTSYLITTEYSYKEGSVKVYTSGGNIHSSFSEISPNQVSIQNISQPFSICYVY